MKDAQSKNSRVERKSFREWPSTSQQLLGESLHISCPVWLLTYHGAHTDGARSVCLPGKPIILSSSSFLNSVSNLKQQPLTRG